MKFLRLILILGCLPCLALAKDFWRSGEFEPLPIPVSWKTKAKPEKVTDYEYVIEWSYQKLKLDLFLAELGLPDRYLRSKKNGTLYLIYEFEGRHTFVVYLHGEEIQGCAAAALFGPDGKTIKLIK